MVGALLRHKKTFRPCRSTSAWSLLFQPNNARSPCLDFSQLFHNLVLPLGNYLPSGLYPLLRTSFLHYPIKIDMTWKFDIISRIFSNSGSRDNKQNPVSRVMSGGGLTGENSLPNPMFTSRSRGTTLERYLNRTTSFCKHVLVLCTLGAECRRGQVQRKQLPTRPYSWLRQRLVSRLLDRQSPVCPT